MIILFTNKNNASKNIADKLVTQGFLPSGENEWQLNGIKMIDTNAETVLDVPTDFETDCILVLSTHKSRRPLPMLTVHFPGNWGTAELGGENKMLNVAYGSKLRQLFLALDKSNKSTELNWNVCIEADHHGPTCRVPIIFIEIGSSENEWNNELAAETIANAIVKSLDAPKKTQTFFGVGGGHYAKEFCKIMLEREIAVGHILPKYEIDDTDEEMLMQAITKNVEKIDEIFILKESTNAKQKEKIMDFAKENGIECELV